MTGATRRAVLLGAATTSLAACSGSPKARPVAHPSPSAAASHSPGQLTGDLRLAGLCAAIENAAVFSCSTVIDAAGKGPLGTLPPPVQAYLESTRDHHTQHATSWNGFLQRNDKPAVADTPLTVFPTLETALAGLTTVPDLLTFLATLEGILAATYITVAASFTAQAGVTTALSIGPVEAQHAAVVALLQGKAPSALALLDVGSAVGPDIFTG